MSDDSRHHSVPWRGFKFETITHPHFGDKPVDVYSIIVN